MNEISFYGHVILFEYNKLKCYKRTERIVVKVFKNLLRFENYFVEPSK